MNSELAALDQSAYDDVNQQLAPSGETKHGMVVEFYLHSVKDEEQSLEQERPIWNEVPYVMIRVPGQNQQIVRRPVRTGQHPMHDNNRFHNEYVAFKQQKSQPLEGTPLSEWPVVDKSQILELAHFGIKSVEHLANLNDGNAQNHMGLSDLKNKAKRWLESATSAAPMAKLESELKERDNKIETLEHVVGEMQKELKKMKKAK